MALGHRVVYTCMFGLFFLIMLALKLDHRDDWNWFLVCLPLWLFDVSFLILLLFRLVSHIRNGHDPTDMTMISKAWFIFGIAMKVSFQVLMCVKLQYVQHLQMFYVFIPLWLLLSISTVRLFPWGKKCR